MKRLIFSLAIFFQMFSASGFETQYYFAGFDIPLFKTQSPRHEQVTTNGYSFLCRKNGLDLSDSTIFINENLSPFIDNEISVCNDKTFETSINSIRIGVGYNDHPEMDGFTTKDYDNLSALNWVLGTGCIFDFIPCVTAELTVSLGIPFPTSCAPFSGMMDQYKVLEICGIAVLVP